MTKPIELLQPIQPDRFQMGTPVDFRLGAPIAVELAKRTLQGNGIVQITDFPLDRQTLVDFSANFGTLMPKYKATGSSPQDYIGDVQIRPDIKPEDRLSTEGTSELHPHTAKSWSFDRPKYFGLLMIDGGWTNQPEGMNGESMFVRLGDILETMKLKYPETFAEDFELLTETQVTFTATHIQDQVDTAPIIYPLDTRGALGFRWKENMQQVIERMASSLPQGERYLQAINRFNAASQDAPHIETLLRPGELVLLDNRTVAHARRPFVSERTDASGNKIYNPRHLYNIHLNADKTQLQEEEYSDRGAYHREILQMQNAEGVESRAKLSLTADIIQQQSPQVLLDLGSGDGTLISELTARGIKAIGVETSKAAIESAPVEVQENTIVADITSLPIEDGTISTAAMIAVLEHVPPENIPRVLLEIHRVLSALGAFVVRVPSDLQRKRDKHYQHFNPQSLRDILEQGNLFTVMEIVGNHDVSTDWELVYRNILNGARNRGLSETQAISLAERIYDSTIKVCDPKKAKRLIAICRKN